MVKIFDSLDKRNEAQFVQEMNDYFFQTRAKEVDVRWFVDGNTIRGFSNKDKSKGVLKHFTPYKSFPEGDSRDKSLPGGAAKFFSEALDDWFASQDRPIKSDIFDEWHQKMVVEFAQFLSERGVFARYGNQHTPTEYDDDPFRCYNRYAKPLNLLLWHHVICQNTPYNEIQDLDLINCLHPAIDSYIFAGVRKTLSKFEKNTPRPVMKRETYSNIVSKSDYDQWIDYFRRTAKRFDVSPLFVESYWKNVELKKD